MLSNRSENNWQYRTKMIKFVILSVIFGVSVGYRGYYKSIPIPIRKSYHDLKVIPVPSYSEKHETQVKVGPGEMPVYMTFKSKASPIHVNQEHKKSKGSFQKSKSVDEPHKLVHEVLKPVLQEIREIIKPYRKVVQVVEPLKEEKITNVHKHQGKQLSETNIDEKKLPVNYDIDDDYLKHGNMQ